MAGMAGGRRLPATHYRKSADKAVGADKTLRCVYFFKFLYLLLFCLFLKVFMYLSPFIFVYQQTRQSGPGSCGIPGYPGIFSKSQFRDSQKSNSGIFLDFQTPFLNDCILRL